MNKKTEGSTKPSALRQQAETKLRKIKSKAAPSSAASDSRNLVHELELHQIELEMQNDELMLSQTKVNAALKQYEDLYDSAPVSYFTLAKDGTIFQANLPGSNLLGVERSELIKRRLGIFVSVQSRPAFNTFLEVVFGSNKKESCEVALVNHDHEQIWVQIEAACSDVLFGKQAVCHAVVIDISRRRKLEAAFHEQNEKFTKLTTKIPYYLAFVNAKTLQYEYVNELYERSFGIPQDKIIGHHLMDVVGKANYQFALEYINEARSGKPVSYENTFDLVSGPRWIQINYSPISDSEGHITSIAVLGFDITERKQAEIVLRESQIRYQLIFENSGTANAIFDTECRLVLQNSLSLQSLGTKPGESIGKTSMEIFGPVQGLAVTERMRHVLDLGLTESFETEFDLATGKKWFRSTYQPLFDEKNTIIGVQVISQNITKDKQTEEILRNSELKLRKAQHFAHIGSWTWDIKTNQLEWSDEMYNIFGLDKSTFSGSLPDVIAQAIHLDDRAKVERSNSVVINEGRPTPVEYRIFWGDGSIRTVWAEAGELLLDAAGAPYLLSGTVQDITERKMVEETLSESEASLKFSQRVAHVGHWTWDTVTNRVTWSDEMMRIFGLDPAMFDGDMDKVIAEAIHPDDREKVNSSNASVMTEQKPVPLDYRVVWPDGSVHTVWAEAGDKILSADGKILKLSGIVQDITERKRAEDLIIQYTNELEIRVAERTADLSRVNLELARALRARDEFLASVSHELRTPLTGILGLSEVLQLRTYGELNDRQQRAMAMIEESGRHLMELINDILDLSKIEAGKSELQIAPCSLADICLASLHLARGMAQQKNQDLQYSPPTETIILQADARRLKQILVNLLGNAIKFTPRNGELGLEVQTNKTEHFVKLTVWDKGLGIEPENLQKLFKPFVQIDGSLAREYPGTGLGLVLVRHLTEMHNGRIEVESLIGEGSRFTVVLPWSPQNTVPTLNTPSTESSSVILSEHSIAPLIMLVDDDEMVLQVVKDFLETKQYRVLTALSGLELLERVTEIHPDILLVDIQMPVMDGLETIRRIRSHTDPLVAEMPVIAVTALAMPGDREYCLRAGANEYMSKPVRLYELMHSIEELLKDKP